MTGVFARGGLLAAALALFAAPLAAQTRTISGKVLEEGSRAPIAAAQLQVTGTAIGAGSHRPELGQVGARGGTDHRHRHGARHADRAARGVAPHRAGARAHCQAGCARATGADRGAYRGGVGHLRQITRGAPGWQRPARCARRRGASRRRVFPVPAWAGGRAPVRGDRPK